MDTDHKPERLRLPAMLDARAAAPLAQDLRSRAGHDLTVEADEVQRLGAQCLQVLLAARRRWHADGRRLHVEAASEPFAWAVALMGANSLMADCVEGEIQ
jgi:chemotaxis protein CheX